MKILSNAPDPRFGGPLKRSLSVARRLRTHDIETIFLTPTGENSFAEKAQKYSFDCLRIDQPRIRSPKRIRENIQFFFGFSTLVRSTQKIIDRKNVDIVHANGPLNYGVALAAKRSDASFVWHFNDTLTPSPLKQISATLAERWADEIVVAADAVSEYFFNDPSDTTTIYAPVDVDQFSPSTIQVNEGELREKFGISEDHDIVGTVGNINPAKGHEYLIDSFALLDEDTHLVIVGRKLDSQQRYYDKLNRQIRNHDLESQVTFAGWRDDIARLLGFFDVFVLTSVTEACPIVVLEAMAMKCPVVATDVGGVREQIPDADHGWVVPATDADAIQTALTDALSSDSDRIGRAEMARNRVEKVFSLDVCVERHVEIYRSLANDSIQ